jgi:hypothetical protein
LEAGSVPPSLNFSQLDFVKPSSGFHPVTWERVMLLAKASMKGIHEGWELHPTFRVPHLPRWMEE